MADKSFRVLLDVTDLYLENFKYVWINVSPRELKTISDLKKYVLRKINLERDVQLFVRDGLLLDEETIVILREDDTVKIKYKIPVCLNLEKESVKESAGFSRKRHCNEDNEAISLKRQKPELVTLSPNRNEDNFVEKKSKKQKTKKQTESPKSVENFPSTSVIKSKTKEVPPINSEDFCCISVEEVKEQTGLSENFEDDNHSNSVEENQAQKKIHKKKHKKKSSITYDQTVTDINLYKTNDLFYSVSSEFIPEKQKKNKTTKTIPLETKRYPVVILTNDSSSKEEEEEQSSHRNESSSVDVNDINSEELNSKNLSSAKTKRKRRRKRKKSAVIVENNCDANIIDYSKSFSENLDENINRKHVLYLSPDRNQKVSSLNNASEIHNPSTSTFVLNKDKFPVIPLDYPKMSTPAQSSSCGVPDWQLSLMPSRNSNLSYNEDDSVLHDKSATESILQSNRENNSEDPLYEALPEVTSLPDVGICIAYKVLELNENYSPMVTDYREGVIERVDPDTDEIEIRLNKEIILPGRSGKFENLKKDEVPEPIVKTHDVLKWSDVISPKILT